MSKEFLGVGWKFPIAVDKGEGGVDRIAMSHHEENIRESILIILSTAKGERVMRPNFGCGINELVFAPANVSTCSLVSFHVREALVLWEPRIEVREVETTADDKDHGKLLVNIEYRVRDTNNVFNLVYPFYLEEG